LFVSRSRLLKEVFAKPRKPKSFGQFPHTRPFGTVIALFKATKQLASAIVEAISKKPDVKGRAHRAFSLLSGLFLPFSRNCARITFYFTQNISIGRFKNGWKT
jgi:hypothetical protein